MGPRVALLHRTTYRYACAVRLGPQWIRLRPRPDPRWATPGFTLVVRPAPSSLHWAEDPVGNAVARVTVPDAVRELTIEVRLELGLEPRNPFDFVLRAGCVRWPFVYTAEEAAALRPYSVMEEAGPGLEALRGETAVEQDLVAMVLSLGERVRQRVRYVARMEEGVWEPERTLAEAQGSCRDSAWLLVQLLRLHGFAARFVSGYLVQLATPDAPDSAELHAWADAYLPGAGWVGIDATSGLLTAEGHVALAAAPCPAGATPVRGTVEPGEAELDTSVTVERLAA